eukprot:scaffold23804_cov72-Phaeocystis_antarctica.AAC.1
MPAPQVGDPSVHHPSRCIHECRHHSAGSPRIAYHLLSVATLSLPSIGGAARAQPRPRRGSTPRGARKGAQAGADPQRRRLRPGLQQRTALRPDGQERARLRHQHERWVRQAESERRAHPTEEALMESGADTELSATSRRVLLLGCDLCACALSVSEFVQ